MTRKTCNMPGCENIVVSNGLCDKHRLRLQRHGSTDETRPKDWGKRSNHPLYGTWVWFKKRSAKKGICKEWKADFWAFVNDVGQKPSSDHALRLIDRDGIYEKCNVEWKEMTHAKGEDRKKFACEYAREWRINNVDKARDVSLRKTFNITLVQYNEMLENQNHACAICGEKETVINYKNSKKINLSVDHCHTTGKIRGLLCVNCNKGLGHFKDNKAIMEKAILYLNN